MEPAFALHFSYLFCQSDSKKNGGKFGAAMFHDKLQALKFLRVLSLNIFHFSRRCKSLPCSSGCVMRSIAFNVMLLGTCGGFTCTSLSYSTQS
jgi:hypothetical protein